jgi:hypothetical protein
MSEQPPVKWLTRWKALGLSVLAFVLISVALFSWYYYSTADLVRVRAEAKALGIPTTWAETGVVVSSPEVIKRFKRIGELSRKLKDYDIMVSIGKVKTGDAQRLKPYLPIPQAARDYHASLDPQIVAEFLTLIDSLPRDPVVLIGERNLTTSYPHFGWSRNVLRYQGERILLASADQLVHEVDRALHYVETQDVQSWMEFIMKASDIAVALENTAGRFTELKTRLPKLADRLDRLADAMSTMLVPAFIGDFLVTNTWFDVGGQFYLGMMVGGGAMPSSDWQYRFFGLMSRTGRATYLRHEIEWIQLVQQHPSPTSLIISAKRIKAEALTLREWMPDEALTKILIPATPIIFDYSVRCQVQLRLLAAELRDQPWPVDPYDPSGKPLRPFLRDGKLMGAYSVYTDGVDNGGARVNDRYFPLYGPLEAPVMVTEP